MTKSKKRIVWGPWTRSEHNAVPTVECPVDAGVASVLTMKPRHTSGSGGSQEAATALSYTVRAWPVTTWESREGVRASEGCYHSDLRDVLVAWVVCVSRYSRWEGEEVTHDWTYYPGETCPDLSRMFDCRFGDAVDDEKFTSAVEFWKLKKFVQA